MFCLKYYIENDFISYKLYIQGMEWGHTHDLYSLEKPMSFIRYIIGRYRYETTFLIRKDTSSA